MYYLHMQDFNTKRKMDYMIKSHCQLERATGYSNTKPKHKYRETQSLSASLGLYT